MATRKDVAPYVLTIKDYKDAGEGQLNFHQQMEEGLEIKFCRTAGHNIVCASKKTKGSNARIRPRRKVGNRKTTKKT